MKQDYASVVLFSYQKVVRPPQRLVGLKKCLNSIHENTLFPFELIVYDNGSNAKIQQFLSRELISRRISTLVLNPPGWGRNQSISMNRSWNLSRGNFLVKIDSDCIVKKGWLLDGVTAMGAFPEMVYWSFMHFPLGTQEKTLLRTIKRGGISVEVHCNSPNTSFMIRRSTWEELGDLSEPFNAIYPAKVVPSTKTQPPITAKKRKGYWRGMNSSNKWLATPSPSRQKVHLISDLEGVLPKVSLPKVSAQSFPLLFGKLEPIQVYESPKTPKKGKTVQVPEKTTKEDSWDNHFQFLPKTKQEIDGNIRSRLKGLKDFA